MDKNKLQQLYNNFLKDYGDVDFHERIWEKQSKEFRKFWRDKVLNDGYAILLESEDLDPIIRILDIKARGARQFREKGGEAAGMPWIYQTMWYKVFRDIKNKKEIKQILDDLFNEKNDNLKIGLVDKLKEMNVRNGLTGGKACILNSFLFTCNHKDYICVLSLDHRFQIIDAFNLGDSNYFQSCSYGEKIIDTNRNIISGFKKNYDINATPRTLTQFLYSIEHLWREGNFRKEKKLYHCYKCNQKTKRNWSFCPYCGINLNK
jgi:hypothetical protein